MATRSFVAVAVLLFVAVWLGGLARTLEADAIERRVALLDGHVIRPFGPTPRPIKFGTAIFNSWISYLGHISFNGSTKIRDDDLKILPRMKKTRNGFVSSRLYQGTTLDLTDTAISNAGLQYLLELDDLAYLWLDNTPISGQGLTHLKSVASIKFLSLAGTKVEGPQLATLASFAHLKGLDLSRLPISDEDLEPITAMSSLMALRLNKTQITDVSLARIANIPGLSALTIAHTNITDAGVDHLKRVSLFWLDLSGTGLTDAGIEKLKSHPLGVLKLSHTAITDHGLKTLAGHHRGLQTLDISHTKITQEGLALLPTMQQLTHLNLSGLRITDAQLPHIAGPELLRLYLSQTEITDRSALLLAQLPNLNVLDLSSTAITDQGVEAINASSSMTWLNLDNTAVTDRAVALLARRKNMGFLSLRGTAITDRCLDDLKTFSRLRKRSTYWPRGSTAGQYSLDLRNTAITKQGVAELRDALPHAVILWGETASDE